MTTEFISSKSAETQDLERAFTEAARFFAVQNYQAAHDASVKLLQRWPQNPDVLNLAALSAYQLGYTQEPIRYLERAIKANEQLTYLHVNLADIHLAQGSADPALRHYRRVLELEPDNEAALEGLKKLTVKMEHSAPTPTGSTRRPARAGLKNGERTSGKSFSRSYENIYKYLSPAIKDDIIDQFEAGVSLQKMTRKSNSQKTPIRITQNQVRDALVTSYIDLGYSDKAYEMAKQFRMENPDPYIHNLLIRSLISSPDQTDQQTFDESVAWANLYSSPHFSSDQAYRFNKQIRSPGDVTIGFLCDYANTPFGTFAFTPMLLALARSGMRVIFYNFSTENYPKKSDNPLIRNITDLSNEELHKQIIDDGVHALFDLNGRLRDENRLEVFTCRSAPLQFNYFNLVATTGIPAFDFVIADEIQVPQQMERFYTEEVLRLPCGVNGALRFLRDVPLSPAPFTQAGHITFASFNAFFKYNSDVFDAWARILHGVPDSHLIIKCQEMARKKVRSRIVAEFQQRDINTSRLELLGWSDLKSLRQLYHRVDLALDTFPYSGGSSTLHALWQGVPVLTLREMAWRSATAASMLHSAALDQLVSVSVDDYVEKAVSFGMDRRYLAKLRHVMPAHIQACDYFNSDLVYRELADKLFQLCHDRLS